MIPEFRRSNRVLRVLIIALLASLSGLGSAPAQDAPTAAVDRPHQARNDASDASAAEQDARRELEGAYQQEYAFLVAQKRELQARIESFRRQATAEVDQTDQHIDALQQALLALGSDARALQQRIGGFQRQRQTAQQNANILDATFQQAKSMFAEYSRRALMRRQNFAQRDEAGKLATVFMDARALLRDYTSVRERVGAFYSLSGRKLEGKIIQVGDIATYGVAVKAAGALAPAGGGELKIWEESNPQDARALAAGHTPAQLGVYLYDSLATAAPSDETEGLIAHIRSGGPIALVIAAVGMLSVLLILARIVLLKRASANTTRVVNAVTEKLKARDLDGALEISQRRKGSAAAVITAALRNIHRDREQLEDVINEAILHESTRLERFGSLIMVISAASPLLGLLGTVIGMITTFQVITLFGSGDPTLLAGGIAIALVNTELGLTVAIPSLLIGSVLTAWASRIKDDMLKAALRVTNLYEDYEIAALRKAA